MGIPRLTQYVQPYGEKVLIPKNKSDDDAQQTPRVAIIDGPALAFHIYYRCLSRHRRARNAFEAIPSYQELGAAVKRWLEQILEYGIHVRAIYFDGLLPQTKKETRLSRLQNLANQLVNFRATHREDMPSRLRESQATTLDVLGQSGGSPFSGFCAPPFLVSVILEALLSSAFSDITKVVPGEADAYCAFTARQIGGTVLTSDSDLLVHNLGPRGRVILFKDIDSVFLPSRGHVLRLIEYNPSAIATQLGVPDLIKTGFFLLEDRHRSLKEAASLARTKEPAEEDFSTFVAQYSLDLDLSDLSVALSRAPAASALAVLARMDGRTSEIVHQLRPGAAPSNESSDVESLPEPRMLDMYLGFLLDDTTKTSAWRCGESLRAIGYSLLRTLDTSFGSVTEHIRKGTRIGEQETALLEESDLIAAMTATASQLKDTMSALQALSEGVRWRAVCTMMVYEMCQSSQKPLPKDNEATRLILGLPEAALSWTFIQLSAQMQAVVFSFRLVAQIVDLLVASQEASFFQASSDLLDALHNLHTALGSLPSLAILLESFEEADHADSSRHVISTLLRRFSMSEGHQGSERKKKRQRTKASLESRSRPAQPRGGPLSQNRFASLLEERG